MRKQMSPTFEKLNLKTETEILVVNAPPSFEPEIALLAGVKVLRSPAQSKILRFALAFVTKQVELDALSQVLSAKADGDAILWIAYPKQSSKQYQCEFNRDSGWDVLKKAGYETVRMVAIDADWSALRFRKVQYIKSLTRPPSRTSSKAGKRRASVK
jgi:hypothetical protein